MSPSRHTHVLSRSEPPRGGCVPRLNVWSRQAVSPKSKDPLLRHHSPGTRAGDVTSTRLLDLTCGPHSGLVSRLSSARLSTTRPTSARGQDDVAVATSLVSFSLSHFLCLLSPVTFVENTGCLFL